MVRVTDNGGRSDLKGLTTVEVIEDQRDSQYVRIRSNDGPRTLFARRFAPIVKTPAEVKNQVGTGKGTTAKLRDFFTGTQGVTVEVKQIATSIGLSDSEGRQLNKRLSELVKSGFLVKSTLGGYRKAI